MHDQPVPHLTIVGFIWDGADGFKVSARWEGHSEIVYAYVPALVERARKLALERGVSVGDLCDEFNEELRQRERVDMIRRGVPFVEIKFKSVDGAAFEGLTEMFNLRSVKGDDE